jgi:hypothetical protein
MLVELVGDVVLGLHQVLLEFLLGIPAPPRGVPQFTRSFGASGVQVGGPQLPGLLCGGHCSATRFGSLPVLGALAFLRLNRP